MTMPGFFEIVFSKNLNTGLHACDASVLTYITIFPDMEAFFLVIS